MTVSSGIERHRIPFIAIVPFLLMAFGLTWGLLALYILIPERMNMVFEKLTGHHPLFFLAVYAPAIAAIVIVAYHSGRSGLRRYFSRLLLWRCSPAWYVFLMLGIPFLFIGGAAIKGNLLAEPLPFSSFKALLMALILMAIKGPIEELGWRGFALPLIQRKCAPIWAGLMVGIIWGVWHFPAFLLGGTPQSAWSFTPFFIGSVAASVIMTPLFNASHGSILLPALFHFQLINPIWPDAQPYDTIFFLGAAALVVWLNRKKMFRQVDGIQDVIPDTDAI
jgi:membrane protease YdiL (CAAX protease family)